MQLRFFGGFALDAPAGDAGASVRGRGQQALLFRLAIDAGATVTYRSLAEDVWPDDLPEDPRASLQSLVSRLRRALPDGVLQSVPRGYRLAVERADVDLAHFQDLVAAARREPDPVRAAQLADSALELWTADPWTPDGFDWVIKDLLEDRAHAERLRRAGAGPVAAAPLLPAPLSRLVGRGDELGLIAAQLATERLVTIVGPGGAGKTTLAVETARSFPGALLVELAPAAPDEVWVAVAAVAARTLRLAESATVPAAARERALEALAGRSLLIVLDNCEHLSLQAAAAAVDLLHALPGARILATSREPLGVPGEAFVDLGPLPPSDATELFVRRVRAARGEAPRPADADAVARIVRRLDGLPLALELAAAKTRTLSIGEIDAGLDDRFALLAVGPRAADPRHQTLRALIDWSWEMLTDPERTALLAASVFPDGLAAADAPVIARHFATDPAAFDLLVDRSLLRRVEGRFRMLETVREYGLDRLRADGREARFRADQARAMVEPAAARDVLLRGPGVRPALAWFDANDENLLAAMRCCAAEGSLHDTGVALVRAAIWAWIMRERIDEIRAALDQFAAEDAPLDSEPAVVLNAVALMARAVSSMAVGEVPPRFAERCEAIVQAVQEHPSELSRALPPLLRGAAARLTHGNGTAPVVWSFEIAEDDPDEAPPWTRALLAVLRAAFAQNGGDVAGLGVHSERALAMFRELGDVWGLALASQMRSEWLMLQGRLEEALEVADASTEALTGLTAVWDVIQQRSVGIWVLVRLGRVDEARERVADIMALARQDGSQRSLLQAAYTAASVEVGAGDGGAALALLDGVDAGDGLPMFDQLMSWGASKRAQALLLLGRTEEAAGSLRASAPAALRSGDQPIVAEMLLALAAWLAQTGRRDDAERTLAASIGNRGMADVTDPFFARVAAQLGGVPDPPAHPADVAGLVALLDAAP